MSRPLHRGISGVRTTDKSSVSWDSQMKDRIEKEDGSKMRYSQDQTSPITFLANLVLPNNSLPKSISSENGFASDSPSVGPSRARQNFTLLLLRFGLIVIVILALSWSLWWTITISNSSRGNIFRGYRRLQEQLITDLADIGVLSLGLAKFKDAELCPPEYENYVHCFNISERRDLESPESNDYERQCLGRSMPGCLIVPPKNYRVPLRWPTGRDVIWIANVKITGQEVLTSGSLTKRMMMLEEDQVSFRSDSLMVDGVEDYAHQIAEMIGLRSESNFNQAGVRTVLDIGCGYGSFGAHLFSKNLLTMCIANYEVSGSQVQLTLERGLPAMINSFMSRRLPYPSLSFDMLHCARCGIDWEQKGYLLCDALVGTDGIYLVEVDRVLRPGGYFVWTSPITNIQRLVRNKENQKKWSFIRDFASNLCWDMLSQEDETVVWKKTSRRNCYASRKSGVGICSKGHDVESPYHQPLQLCIGGTYSRRWIPIEKRKIWPSRAWLNSTELNILGVHPEEFDEDAHNWNSMIVNYWSLLSPLIFSDHPKRPGDEDPSPPFNMFRNVMDMNSRFGGFNAALLNAGKSVWVMNVVPTLGPNNLPLILDRGFVGALHDWCEAFPTYPRTYDLLHAEGLLCLQFSQSHKCSMFDLFLEMDRILRPEGWVVLRDTASLIETARAVAAQLRWDVRVVEIESNSDERLLICQKPFNKNLQKINTILP